MIVLAETTPALQQISLLAEFASRQPRPELKHVLRLAEDGSLSEQIVFKRLKVSERAAFNILNECASLGLIDQQGSLTPEGKAFLKDESGLTYVPEHGCFNVLLARHPAFGQVLLNIERTPEDIELADITDQHDVILRPGDKAPIGRQPRHDREPGDGITPKAVSPLIPGTIPSRTPHEISGIAIFVLHVFGHGYFDS